MREELLNNILPEVKKFVDRASEVLEKKQGEIEIKEKNLFDSENLLTGQREAFKKQEIEYKKELDLKFSQSDEARREFERLSVELDEEKKKYNTLNEDLRLVREQLKIEVEIAKDNTLQTTKQKEQADNLRLKYESLIKKLGNDFDKLNKDTEKYNQDKAKLLIQQAEHENKVTQFNSNNLDFQRDKLEFELTKKRVAELVAQYKLEDRLKNG